MSEMKTFGLIGASGYIAERHYNAIKSVGGVVTHIYDTHNSAGVIDRYFKEAIFCDSETEFFTAKTDYKVICTPNYLHYDHIMAASVNSKVISEKPLCLTSEQGLELSKLDVNCILQLRYNELPDLKGDITIDYCTPRGDWYYKSWKGDKNKSGGIATNIGIHLFDFVTYAFGPVKEVIKKHEDKYSISGILVLEDRKVNFNLSTDPEKEPKRIIVADKDYDLSGNFEDLHIRSYKEILAGKGWTPSDCLESIKIAEKLR